MIMDVMRRCYKTKARVWIDDIQREEEIVWQWCSKEAKPLPHAHSFPSASLDYVHGFDHRGIGEIRGSRVTFIDGDALNKLPGKCKIGSETQFIKGIRTTDPAMPTPDCCRAKFYSFKASGGLRTSGDATTSVKPHLMASGGLKLSGSAVVVVHRNLVCSGSTTLAGTASTALRLLQAANGLVRLNGEALYSVTPAEFVIFDPDDMMPVAIPDNDPAGVVLTFTISGVDPTFRLTALNLSITHPDPSQLTFFLTSPSSVTFSLGSYASTILISLFNDAPNGIWQLRVVDQVAFNIGQVVNAQLVFRIARQFQAQAAMLARYSGSASSSLALVASPSGGMRFYNSASVVYTPAGSSPPCGHSNQYRFNVSGNTCPTVNQTYTVPWMSGEQWIVFAGGWFVILDLTSSPYSLLLSSGPNSATYTSPTFDCSGLTIFARTTVTGSCSGWATTLQVTKV